MLLEGDHLPGKPGLRSVPLNFPAKLAKAFWLICSCHS